MTHKILGDAPIRYQDRVRIGTTIHPHIYYRNGWWRVSPCNTKNPILVRLFNLAHQYAARLNNKRPREPVIPQPTPLRNEKRL